MLLGSPAFVLVAITARVDVTLVLALVAAHLALLAAADAPAGDAAASDDRRLLVVAAALVAVAMGIKPQAGAYAIALIPLGWRAARGWRAAIVAATVAAALSAPWYLKNLWLVGAPLYPKGAPGWFEPWLAELFRRPRPCRRDRCGDPLRAPSRRAPRSTCWPRSSPPTR
jgi:4-amino-4-deoxy-L-arabinose transferase-like glycosyltransferase